MVSSPYLVVPLLLFRCSFLVHIWGKTGNPYLRSSYFTCPAPTRRLILSIRYFHPRPWHTPLISTNGLQWVNMHLWTTWGRVEGWVPENQRAGTFQSTRLPPLHRDAAVEVASIAVSGGSYHTEPMPALLTSLSHPRRFPVPSHHRSSLGLHFLVKQYRLLPSALLSEEPRQRHWVYLIKIRLDE